MNAAWEYAVLRVYPHFPDPNTGEDLWALQTHGGIEHDKLSTDELALLNELGRAGWRLRFRTAARVCRRQASRQTCSRVICGTSHRNGRMALGAEAGRTARMSPGIRGLYPCQPAMRVTAEGHS